MLSLFNPSSFLIKKNAFLMPMKKKKSKQQQKNDSTLVLWCAGRYYSIFREDLYGRQTESNYSSVILLACPAFWLVYIYIFFFSLVWIFCIHPRYSAIQQSYCSNRVSGHLEMWTCQVYQHTRAPQFMHSKSGPCRKSFLRSHTVICTRA